MQHAVNSYTYKHITCFCPTKLFCCTFTQILTLSVFPPTSFFSCGSSGVSFQHARDSRPRPSQPELQPHQRQPQDLTPGSARRKESHQPDPNAPEGSDGKSTCVCSSSSLSNILSSVHLKQQHSQLQIILSYYI